MFRVFCTIDGGPIGATSHDFRAFLQRLDRPASTVDPWTLSSDLASCCRGKNIPANAIQMKPGQRRLEARMSGAKVESKREMFKWRRTNIRAVRIEGLRTSRAPSTDLMPSCTSGEHRPRSDQPGNPVARTDGDKECIGEFLVACFLTDSGWYLSCLDEDIGIDNCTCCIRDAPAKVSWLVIYSETGMLRMGGCSFLGQPIIDYLVW